MTAPRSRLMWAVKRDGKIFVVAPARWRARAYAASYRPGSKHKWSVCRVRVTPIKNRKHRR